MCKLKIVNTLNNYYYPKESTASLSSNCQNIVITLSNITIFRKAQILFHQIAKTPQDRLYFQEVYGDFRVRLPSSSKQNLVSFINQNVFPFKEGKDDRAFYLAHDHKGVPRIVLLLDST